MSASPEITLEPRVLQWARNRAGLSEAEVAAKTGAALAKVVEWERSGRIRVTQADKLAKATFTPEGYLFLPTPPVEQLPITDFRVVANETPEQPSPNLLAVLDDCERRRDWYREYLLSMSVERLDFVGTLSTGEPILTAAARIRERHRLTLDRREEANSWEEALRLEIEQIEASDILVMRSGIVGNNTHRALDVREFRGFALADEYAPLIFLNGRDARAAQIFTLLHELVHVWLGESGLSNLDKTRPPRNRTERFCSAVAAEILVPEAVLRERWAAASASTNALVLLCRQFKVSSLVMLRRLLDVEAIDRVTFEAQYAQEEDRFREQAARDGGGGDFYRTQRSRSSSRFATALIESTLEGRTPWRDAFSLLGVRKFSTFTEMARTLGFSV